MRKEIKLVPKKLRKDLRKQTYINLNHIQISSSEKLVELGQMINNSIYNFFRIIYIKDNIIIGENIINISYIICHQYFKSDINARIKSERCVYKLANQMQLLKADSYYIIHSSSIGNDIVLKEYINTTKFFNDNLKGFRGHLIINSNSYYWINIKDKNIMISKIKHIKQGRYLRYSKFIKNKINNKKDVLKLVYSKQNNKDNSIIIITNYENIMYMAIDIPNKIYSKEKKKIEKYLKAFYTYNLKVFLITKDCNIFDKSIIENKIIYKEINGETYIIEGGI